jgi:hypothetical protein
MKFEELTEEQKAMLADKSFSAEDLTQAFNKSVATIARWRKKLGVKIGKGCKKGKPKPWQEKKVEYVCLNCSKLILGVPSDERVYCSVVCMRSHPDYREKLRNMDKSYMQTEDYKQTLRKVDTPDYTRYKNLVHRLSEKEYQQHIDTINPLGYTRTLCGVDGGYQLDHIVTVRFGFDNNIPAEVLAEKNNLRMLPWKENLSRNKKR